MFSFGKMSPEEFLKEYWQKKPLLIRQAFPNFESPVSADDLAGLACEEGIESRIVLENDKGKPWQVKNGPFNEKTFRNLPSTHWTLLIQGVDYWVPPVSDLLEEFRFIPNWRIDDIMASYAPPHGSVGPHFDYYDVFLLQAQGRRSWKVGPACSGEEARVQGTPLRILKDFETVEEWVLEPGDMLYLPPQVAHYGVAIDDCITLSIGFRSPTHQEMLSSWTDFMCERMQHEAHLDDPNLSIQPNPGEITPATTQQVEEIFRSYLNDRSALMEWFGRYTTQPKYEGVVEPLESPLRAASIKKQLAQGARLRRNEGSRLSYARDETTILLFADGESVRLQNSLLPIVERLCATNSLDSKEVAPWLQDSEGQNLLVALINQGSLYLEEDE